MSVVGVVDGQTTSGLSGPAEKKSKKAESKKSSTSAKPARSDKSVKSSDHRLPQPPTRASPPLPLPTRGFLISTSASREIEIPHGYVSDDSRKVVCVL